MSDRPIRLPPLFAVHFEGSTFRALERSVIVPSALPHLLTRMFTGQTVTVEAFRPFGLRVTIEEDTDAGDDEPSSVIYYRPSWDRER